MFQVNLIAHVLRQQTDFAEVFAYFTKPLGIKLPPYFDIVHFGPSGSYFQQVSAQVCQLR